MDFAFNEEQEELRASARSFLTEHSGSEQIRQAIESERGYDPEIWKRIGSELGWTAVTIPEVYGGLGLSAIELTALLEVMGESLLCAPFFSSVCLGANALLVAGSEEQKLARLPGIAAGDTTATLAHAGPGGAWDAAGIEATWRQDGGGYVLSGEIGFVLDGHSADVLIIAARAAESEEEAEGMGVSLFCVDGDASGLARRALPTLDQTRRLASISCDEVALPPTALMGERGAGWPLLEEILARAVTALAAEQVGGAQRCLDMAVEYAKERVQFGRPIGSFQAIKHKCADMMVAVECARSAAYYAACVAADGGDDLLSVASLAKAYCSDAYFRCAADSIQIHGGVGFTWEYDVHLYFKRARSSEMFLGDATYHRELLARRIL